MPSCGPSRVDILNTGSIAEQYGRPHLKSLSCSDLLVDIGQNDDCDDENNAQKRLQTDHDVMFVFKDLVICNVFPNTKNRKLELDTSGTDVGFEHFVRVNYSGTNKLLTNSEAVDHLITVVRNTGIEQKIKRIFSRLKDEDTEDYEAMIDVSIKQEGPSVCMKVVLVKLDYQKVLMECDFLFALPLGIWPQAAHEWTIRPRNWPNKEFVDWLVNNTNCCVVPKPRYPTDTDYWRISFSRQEVELANILPGRARNIYLRFKLLYKQELKEKYPEYKSYHMKTTFNWWMEEQELDTWEEGKGQLKTSAELLDSLVRKFKSFISNSYLPHYFLSSVNLMPTSEPVRAMLMMVFSIMSAKAWKKKIGNRPIGVKITAHCT